MVGSVGVGDDRAVAGSSDARVGSAGSAAVASISLLGQGRAASGVGGLVSVDGAARL